MYVVLAAAISIDGKIKHAGQGHARGWISDEDKADFEQLLTRYDVVVMGRKTYKSMGLRASPARLHVVMTREPERHRAESTYDNIEFTDTPPRQLIKQLEGSGSYGTLLVIGGKDVYASFLKAGLVDQLLITIEPILLGVGTPFIDTTDMKIELHLIESRQLNPRGTLRLTMDVDSARTTP